MLVEESRASLTVTIARSKADLARRTRSLNSVQSAIPYDVGAELQLEGEIKVLTENISRAEAILAERF